MIDTLEQKPSVSVRWILNIEVKLNLINNFSDCTLTLNVKCRFAGQAPLNAFTLIKGKA